MDFYLDFEATQFKENIIAIGATCENGSFDCLVRPPQGDKITKFITQLTGIINEMTQTALTIEEAFYDLLVWMAEVKDTNDWPDFYHAYGNMDKIFVEHAIPYISNPVIKEFAQNLAKSLIDDSQYVNRFFCTKAIGISRAFHYFEPDTPSQDHDPLNDAIMLYNTMKHIRWTKPLEESPFENKESKNRSMPSGKIFKQQINVKNAPITSFDNITLAVDWIYKIIKKNNPNAARKNVKTHLKDAIKKGKPYHGYYWKKECDIK